MELYLKFMFTLAVGLVGVGMVVTTLLETIFHDWDVARDLERGWRAVFSHKPQSSLVRAEDILLELEKSRREGGRRHHAPADALDRRREALRELREAEHRLASPNTPEVV